MTPRNALTAKGGDGRKSSKGGLSKLTGSDSSNRLHFLFAGMVLGRLTAGGGRARRHRIDLLSQMTVPFVFAGQIVGLATGADLG